MASMRRNASGTTKDVDLHGKIAVVLINDADFEADAPGAFDGKAVTTTAAGPTSSRKPHAVVPKAC